ncbi:MAG TPA: N-acetyltransferase [Terriglobales bacterium]|nr:N-acetyltransferase [Terriglobales bacterium]
MATAALKSVEILDLRHFGSQELRPLLEEEIELWDRMLGWDYSGSAEMVLRYMDARILPGYVAVEGRQVLGYSFFVYEGSKGIIGDLFVSAGGKAQRHGNDPLEHRLLTHVIETLEQSPGVHRIESQLLPHKTGRVARPFLETGFRRYPRLFMVWPLELRTPADSPAEIEVRPWREEDFQSAAAVITAAYRGHVDAEINDQYRTVAGSLRFLNNIVRFPGCGTFDGEASFVAVHRPTQLMAGLILCSKVRHDVGHITQVCVAPEFRGQKLGERLIAACHDSLLRRKFTSLSLTVTEANANAVELYKRLGFAVTHVFDAFVWEG